jgi:predicted lipid-binding transport protein (Tim44 family)
MLYLIYRTIRNVIRSEVYRGIKKYEADQKKKENDRKEIKIDRSKIEDAKYEDLK